MNRRLSLVVAFCLLAVATVSLAACSSTPAQTGTAAPAIRVTDQLGRTVSLEDVPQRIISLAPSNTEILFALGLGDRVVGVTEYDDYPEDVRSKPQVGGFSTVDTEKVVSAAPDLVLATSIHEAEVIPGLEQLGLKVVALAPKSMDEVYAAIALVGECTGAREEAAQIAADMKARVRAVSDKTAGLAAGERPRVFYVVSLDPLYAAGSGTFIDTLIELAGGTNIFKNTGGFPVVSLENVVEANPQVIINGTRMGSAQSATAFFRTDDRLAGLDARADDRIYTIDVNIVSRPGPRLVEGLEQFSRMIRPDIFGAP